MTPIGAHPPGTRIPSLGPRGEGWVALQFALLAAIAGAGWLLGGAWSGVTWQALLVVGGLLIVAGLAIAGLGVVNLDRSLSALPRPTDRAVLVSHGVYRQVRHPIYAGLVSAALGWSLATASLAALGLSVLLAIVLDLKSRREEDWLRGRFAGYADYAARTRRFLPGIY
jgi:protein-S-isoprenylcysteine O-methyltransferase Ste14